MCRCIWKTSIISRKNFRLLTGVQAIYVLRHFYDYFNDTSIGDQSHENNFFGLNPKIGLLYELNDDSQAFINFSRTFQPPSFDNMVAFDDGPGVSLTYTPLQPQHAWTIETGTRGKHGRFDWDLAVYHSWVRDELQDLFDAKELTAAMSTSPTLIIKALKPDSALNCGIPKKLEMKPDNR